MKQAGKLLKYRPLNDLFALLRAGKLVNQP